MSDIREKLEEMRERSERLSGKMWWYNAIEEDGETRYQVLTDDKRSQIIADVPFVEDAKFIAHARQDIPRLLDALERALGKLDEKCFCSTLFLQNPCSPCEIKTAIQSALVEDD